ncbi:MAG: sigma-70 family RNA polymerase sigma factor [Candidatus Zixiibacteriota bacterium]
MEETELIRQFKNGDKSAFRQLVEKYQDSVINTSYRFLRNKEEAEETAQEVFLKVYLSSQSYQPKAKFSTWLFKIVANCCLNKLRDKKKFSSLQLDKDLPASTEDQPDKSLERQELKRLLTEAIDSLPENQRTVILLNQDGEFSYQEMAKMLDCSVSAVESRIFRAKDSLKKILSPYLKE